MSYYKISRIIVYILCFAGIFVGFYYLPTDKYKGIRLFSQIAIIPMSLNAFITHTFFRGNIIKSPPFFEIEAGGASLGVAVALIVASIMKYNINTLAIILLIYAVYLTIALIATYIYIGWKNSLEFFPIVAILYYFSIVGLLA